jgi:hypothetical protein
VCGNITTKALPEKKKKKKKKKKTIVNPKLYSRRVGFGK